MFEAEDPKTEIGDLFDRLAKGHRVLSLIEQAPETPEDISLPLSSILNETGDVLPKDEDLRVVTRLTS